MSPRAKQIWLRVPGVPAPKCNHATRSLVEVTASITGKYETLECRKCGVRKQFRVWKDSRTLISAVAIKRYA